MSDLGSEALDGSNIAVEWTGDGGYAFRPGEVLVRGDDARLFLGDLLDRRGDSAAVEFLADGLPPELTELMDMSPWARLVAVTDELAVVRSARTAGYTVQPNHALFADACGTGCSCCPPHPSLANDLGLLSNPFQANPFQANPFQANPFQANRSSTNSAIPAKDPGPGSAAIAAAGDVPRVVIFDTGMADAAHAPGGLAAASLSGDDEWPDLLPTTGDGYLDPAAGHGTFIAGIIERRCPGLDLRVRHVVGPRGDSDEWTLAKSITAQLAEDLTSNTSPPVPFSSTIWCMSLSGYIVDESSLLAQMVALAQALGVVIVASVGNLASCRPAFPAAYPGVIGVGALGPNGPAPFTSYGPWVRACAPGVDIVSTFFDNFDGSLPSINGVDPDHFAGWARWSGTSFAAPGVVAALGRDMLANGGTTAEAIARVIDAPRLARIQNLGTIVNI